MKLFLSKIRISVVNGDPARFISFLKERDIIFSHIQLRDGALCGDLFPKDLPLAREAARQLGMELSVIQRQGPFYLVAPYRKRIGLIVGGILAALLLLFLQNFVWEITVPEGHNISTEVILRVLEECGLHKGSYLPNCDLEKIRLTAMGKLPDVSFFALNRKGSRIEVALTEKVPKPQLNPEEPCNIVAAKAGTVLEMEVYSGQAVVAPGDTVKEGGLLVSGIIENKDGRFYCRRSSAKVTALTYFEKEFFISLENQEIKLTGEVKFQKYWILFGQRIPLFLKKADKTGCLVKSHTEPLRLFGVPLPIEVETEIISYYDQVMTAFSEEEALVLLEKAAALYEAESLAQAEIVKRRLFASRNEGLFTLHIDYQCIENIAVSSPIKLERSPVE